MKRARIRKDDQVVVIAGRDKGKRGRVLAVAPARGKVKVEASGMIKRHQSYKVDADGTKFRVATASGHTLEK